MARVSRLLVAKIVRLLHGDAVEKQIAAAIVLGELRVRDPEAVAGLLALLASGVPALARHALVALTATGTPKVVPHALPLLGTRDEGVRKAAADAVVGAGADALAAVRERLAAAAPHERRALEEILARLGGDDALSTLLGGLDGQDLDAARAAVLPLRQRVKDADARERRRTIEHTLKFLASKRAAAAPAARVAAIKILGFLEDPAAARTLLAHALDRKEHEAVRSEAVVALRLAAQPKKDKQAGKGAAGALERKLEAALVTLTATAPLAVARVAFYSLGTLGGSAPATPPPAIAHTIAKLVRHVETERARLAIEYLGQAQIPEAGRALAGVLLETVERTRAEAAAAALEKRSDGPAALARALVQTNDRERAQLIVSLLRPRLGALDARQADALVVVAARRLEENHPTWEPLLHAARGARPESLARRLRALGDTLRKARKSEQALRVFRALGRSADASPDDGYALASLELTAGRRDEAFAVMGQLQDRGYDVAAAMRRDRSLDHEHRYLVGFHFAERGLALGEELLLAVAQAAGRTKVGQMARAKLRSSGLAAQS